MFFFFNDPATTEIYTLSLHDALPISSAPRPLPTSYPPHEHRPTQPQQERNLDGHPHPPSRFLSDRKSTRLNSSHGYISYAVFCLKKKKIQYTLTRCREANGTCVVQLP